VRSSVVGGIFNADDRAGEVRGGRESCLQIYTGFVYEGPLVASEDLPRGLTQANLRAIEQHRTFYFLWHHGRGSADINGNTIQSLVISLDITTNLHANF